MREQLIQYVELLFAGAPNSTEIKQEILQNTLDRYDDLVSQGKSPEAAYRLAISGIGDINEIINSETEYHAPSYEAPRYEEPVYRSAPEETKEDKNKKLNRAIAVAMYILCPFPLIILSEFGESTIGLFLMFLLIAAATFLLIMNGEDKKEAPTEGRAIAMRNPESPIKRMIGIITLIIYLVISFSTGAWFITWLIFPIATCVKQLIRACMDLKEASEYEN